MPEARDRLVGPAGAGHLAVGFGVHQRFDGRSRLGWSGQDLQYRAPSDNKENIPAESSRSARRRTRPRKSPLPSWYPRSPLQDITAVVRAMERRRGRLRLAAELRRRQERANHSPVPLPNTPPRQELPNSEQLSSPLREGDSETDPLLPAATKSSLQPIEDAPETLPPTDGLAPGNRTLTAAEKKREELIDEFQKVVTKNLKSIQKDTPRKKTERSTLMSMR